MYILFGYIVWIYSIDNTETPALSAENLSANDKKARVKNPLTKGTHSTYHSM